jgi:hypothetical protein
VPCGRRSWTRMTVYRLSTSSRSCCRCFHRTFRKVRAIRSDVARVSCAIVTLCVVLAAALCTVELTMRLKEIFDEIDLDCDGTLTWDEFSLFCIASAVAAARMEAKVAPNVAVRLCCRRGC